MVKTLLALNTSTLDISLFLGLSIYYNNLIKQIVSKWELCVFFLALIKDRPLHFVQIMVSNEYLYFISYFVRLCVCYTELFLPFV